LWRQDKNGDGQLNCQEFQVRQPLMSAFLNRNPGENAQTMLKNAQTMLKIMQNGRMALC